jgi:ubiquinone/menaquinone biosynthesis C-methylase UbiE
VNAMAPVDAYRLWAPTYDEENAVTVLENALVARLSPAPRGLRLLDCGCGTGRRLVDSGAETAVGVDLSPDMLAAGKARFEFASEVELRVADMADTGLAAHSFDLLWCRLAIGHVVDCRPVYRELARLADFGARVIVTDFHPAAWAAGHRRSFRHGERRIEVAHHVHSINAQIVAAREMGLALIGTTEATIGPEVRSFYEATDKLALYERDCGLPVVSALAFVRDG